MTDRHAQTIPPGRAGWYKRVIAAALSRYGGGHELLVAGRKRTLFGDLAGTVLEIGPGGGPNLRYFGPEVRWIGVEPNPYMHQYLRKSAAQVGRDIDLRLGAAEALPVEDESIDAVVSTLVLCSVADQEQTLAEIRRVLRPGGIFLFVEHVAAPAGSWLRRVQDALRPGWQIFGDGCQPNRETWRVIAQAGFEQVRIEHFDLPLPIIRPHIAGSAAKRG
jgi:ubiquinone/menaquinone biosynthesis C-methylase UbiE